MALTRFRRALKYARREVRGFTHTLYLPPALWEIYGGPRPDWLREILDYLPCLQSLMVSRLPFLDHRALTALRNHQSSGQYNVRLLLADHEPNTTSASLAETLPRFALLTYLDLSYTTPARDWSVLSSLSQLTNLQVLKLRGIGLKDQDAEVLANAIKTRVRYLDLRNNLLTDMAGRSLLQASFMPPSRPRQRSRRVDFSWEPMTTSHQSPGIDFLKSPDVDKEFLKLLAQPISNHLWLEDLPHVGITHLYIADNRITVEGVASLLASSRLHALDAGTVNGAGMVNKTVSQRRDKCSGTEKLVPLLANVAGENLTYLRAHHAVLTAEPLLKDVAFRSDLLSGLATNKGRRETELEAPQEVAPAYEVADTSITESACPIADSTPVLPSYEDQSSCGRRRGSTFAPGAVQTMPDGALLQARSAEDDDKDDDTRRSISSISATSKVLGAGFSQPVAHFSSHSSSNDHRAEKIQELLAKRPQNRSMPLQGKQESRFPCLHPSHIPHVETLVLTDVPSHIPPNSPVLYTLTRFITACSNEALLATLQAESDYSLPPGQARMRAEQQRSRSVFGLRRIILEVTATEASARMKSWKSDIQHSSTTNSSTGDPDSETLWAAAADDFSFFGGEEECSILGDDPGDYSSMAELNETSAASSKPNMPRIIREEQQLVQDVDVVAGLAAFRRAKKAEYEQVVQRDTRRRSTNQTGSSSALTGSGPPVSMAQFVEGHWKGEVKVVRDATPKVRSGTVDIHRALS